MPLKVLPLRLRDFAALISHADTSPPGDDLIAPPNPVTWPVTNSTAAHNRLEFCMAMQQKRFLHDPTCNFVKVVDQPENCSEDDAEIISVARWHRYPKGYVYATEGHWEMARPYVEALQNKEKAEGLMCEAHDFILSARDGYRKEWTPKSEVVWFLMHLVTRPSRRGHGSGGMLIRWGLDRAKEEGACAYLEAGAAAKGLYERYGFNEVGEVRMLDLKPYGLDMRFQLANMRWQSQESENEEDGLPKPSVK